MPRTPMEVSASRTSSSLNGLIAAMMSFTWYTLPVAGVPTPLPAERQRPGGNVTLLKSGFGRGKGNGATAFTHGSDGRLQKFCANFDICLLFEQITYIR